MVIIWMLGPITLPVARAQRQPVAAEHGMVVSVHELGSQAGVEILKKGGNAVDAAIATGFALAAVYPSAGNLAGGGFMLIHRADDNRQIGIDYRETAPAAAHRDMYLAEDGSVMTELGSSRMGWRASGVPGTVDAFARAFLKYGSGRVTWAEIIEPARRLAEGHVLTRAAVELLQRDARLLSRFEESRRVLLNNGESWRVGDVWRQPDLAATLARLQEHGPREFYEGETARRIADAMRENGGTITLEDLKGYRAIERVPLRHIYRGHEIVGMPPPSSGAITLFQMLAMIEPYDVRGMGHNSAAKHHLFAEVMRRAFRDRIEYIGDPAFVSVPIAEMLDRNYLAGRMADFDPMRVTASAGLAPGLGLRESAETTHFSVVDREGNAVSNTYTLRNSFGSGVTIPGTGLLMNNVMDDLAAKVGVPNMHGLMQGPANAIEPGKRALSSQTPAMVFRDGRLLLVTGSPGGPTIINTVFQIITNVIDFKMPVMQAVEAPRIHHQWLPDELTYEPFGLSSDTAKLLEGKGHKLTLRTRYQGQAETIMIDPATGMKMGAADPRHPDARAVGH
ncbi:MAG: gamma-glutamyltransferase [Opitutaceae bacterium]|nr:gamma-glutamyltransferase [Opitutaceae bacterium]